MDQASHALLKRQIQATAQQIHYPMRRPLNQLASERPVWRTRRAWPSVFPKPYGTIRHLAYLPKENMTIDSPARTRLLDRTH